MSIFVNPLQFNNLTDLEKYPRTLERDIEKAQSAGVDILFTPSVTEIYSKAPTGANQETGASKIIAGNCSAVLEGPSRPGHFDGVTTVVGILFNLVQPNIAVFGEKDFQQLRVIQQMVRDLHFPIEIIPDPTMRDPDGLAMSSRNSRLSAEQRSRALSIPRALQWAREKAKAAGANAHSIIEGVTNRLQQEGNLKVDYVAIVDSDTLTQDSEITNKSQILVAAFVDEVRLIDNCRLI
jgi:pantoate--beta-alanine ligase